MSDVLLIVAIRTDQRDIQRRIETVLAVSVPHREPPETEPCVYAREVSELTQDEFDALAHFMTERGVHRLNIGAEAPA